MADAVTTADARPNVEGDDLRPRQCLFSRYAAKQWQTKRCGLADHGWTKIDNLTGLRAKRQARNQA